MRSIQNIAGLCIVAIAILLLSGCKLTTPAFKTVDNVRFEKIGAKGLKLGADVTFNNPNRMKCRITDIDVNLVLDDKLIGTLGEKSDVIVNKQKDFKIPVGILIKPEGTILEDLETCYKIIANKESELYFVGNIQVRVMGFKFTVPVKYRQKVKRSDFR